MCEGLIDASYFFLDYSLRRFVIDEFSILKFPTSVSIRMAELAKKNEVFNVMGSAFSESANVKGFDPLSRSRDTAKCGGLRWPGHRDAVRRVRGAVDQW